MFRCEHTSLTAERFIPGVRWCMSVWGAEKGQLLKDKVINDSRSFLRRGGSNRPHPLRTQQDVLRTRDT